MRLDKKKSGFIFEDVTGKYLDKLIKEHPDKTPLQAIQYEVEKATDKKIGCSRKNYGFKYQNYSSDIDKI